MNAAQKRVCRFVLCTSILCLCAACLAAKGFYIKDGDYYWHLALGREIWQTRSVVHIDTLSWYAQHQGYAYIDHTWLSDLLLYGLTVLVGSEETAALLFAVFMAAALMAVVALYWGRPVLSAIGRKDNGGLLATAALPVVVYFVQQAFARTAFAKPQAISFLFYLIMAAMGDTLLRHGRWITAFCFPLLGLLWVNLHGGMFPLLLAYLAGMTMLCALPSFRFGTVYHEKTDAWKKFAAAFCMTAFAGLLNPYGLGLYKQYLRVSEGATVTNMAEWFPITTQRRPLFFVLLIVLFSLASLRLLPLCLEKLGALGLAAVMTMLHARCYPLFMLCFAGLFLEEVGKLAQRLRGKGKQLPAFLPVAGLLLGAAWVISGAVRPYTDPTYSQYHDPETWVSEEVLTLLAEIQPERLGNYLNHGGYLEYRGFHPLMDSRVDMYDAEVLTLPTKLIYEPEATLEKYDFDCLFFAKPEEGRLISSLEYLDGWQCVYDDGLYVVYLPKQVVL